MLRIRELIKEKGITAAALSELTGIFPAQLSRIINGANTTTEQLNRIAKALNVYIVELFEQPEVISKIICPHCKREIKIEVK